MENENFSELNRFETLQSRLHEQAERAQIMAERFEHRLPPVLYHVTTKDNAKRILESGLMPSLRMQGDKEVVSLSDDIGFAKKVVMETQQTENPDDLVVLQIETRNLERDLAESFLNERREDVLSPEAQEELRKTAPQALKDHLHEVHYQASIAPEAISVFKEGADPNAAWKRSRIEAEYMRELEESRRSE